MTAILKISEHAPYPGTRFSKDSQYSGEWFRDEVLLPFIQKHLDEEIIIDFEDVPGYTSSFLEEVFGGLIRKQPKKASRFKELIKFQTPKLDHMVVFKELAERHFSYAFAARNL